MTLDAFRRNPIYQLIAGSSLILSLVFSQTASSQVENTNEVSLNALNLIAYKWLDVSYERTINDESSIGISVLTNLDSEYIISRSYSVTPYYRHFFSNGYANGFFLEAFTMMHGGKRTRFYDNTDNKNFDDLAFGVSIGEKWVTKRGFTATTYTGIGRNLFDENAPEIVARLGISFGFRF